jgi:hypothetical protein
MVVVELFDLHQDLICTLVKVLKIGFGRLVGGAHAYKSFNYVFLCNA